MDKKEFMSRAMEAALRISLVAVIIMSCLMIIKPFVPIVLWAIIIAVSVRPSQERLARVLGGRFGLSAVLFTFAGLALIIVPTVLFADSVLNGASSLISTVENNALQLPPPPAWFDNIPFLGSSITSTWNMLSTDLIKALQQFGPQVKDVASWLVSVSAGLGFAVFQFVASVIIAGLFLRSSESGAALTKQLFTKFSGKHGEEYAIMAIATIRSVAMGVVGVAVIQAFLAGIGMLVAGFPHAGLWALIIMVVAIMQIPVLPVTLLLVAYGFKIFSTTGAIVFLIWFLIVGLSDNVLRPIFFGRGVDIPMLVILLGAIGGMLLMGLIGLFLGAIIMSLGYKLFQAWLYEEEEMHGS
ncbi:AI-2E family transporter [Desulfovibrio inopinatus]|uniref:AI-2E family transporter n=1 Tax=Desulfovibrio inopinatus TaxID=102109 RepID=UPI00041B66E1|nr:AI-2E family transporter [Desulfovibrio inopinatus]